MRTGKRPIPGTVIKKGKKQKNNLPGQLLAGDLDAVLTKEMLADAITEAGGSIQDATNILKNKHDIICSAYQLYKRVKKWDLDQVAQEAWITMVNEAQYSLRLAVQAGESWAVQFVLRTKGHLGFFVPDEAYERMRADLKKDESKTVMGTLMKLINEANDFDKDLTKPS